MSDRNEPIASVPMTSDGGGCLPFWSVLVAISGERVDGRSCHLKSAHENLQLKNMQSRLNRIQVEEAGEYRRRMGSFLAGKRHTEKKKQTLPLTWSTKVHNILPHTKLSLTSNPIIDFGNSMSRCRQIASFRLKRHEGYPPDTFRFV